MKKHTATGFTLIELLIAFAVLGVLLSIGVPAFTDLSNSNRVVSSANEFITALNLTRSEATKRGQPVTICPSNTAQTACVDSANWATGWLVFEDGGATAGSLDAGEPIIQAWPTLSGMTVTQTTATHFVRYSWSGAPANGVTTKFNIVNSVSTTYPRCISVVSTGRINLEKTACT